MDNLRNKMVSLFQNVFEKECNDPETASAVSKSIESACYNCFYQDQKNYKNKLTELLFNIKGANQDLRKDLLVGRLDPSQLLDMKTEDFASAKIKQERKQIESNYRKDKQGEGPVGRSFSSAFTCKHCKESKCTYYQLQTRSADEPMTTFVTCTVCKTRWKC